MSCGAVGIGALTACKVLGFVFAAAKTVVLSPTRRLREGLATESREERECYADSVPPPENCLSKRSALSQSNHECLKRSFAGRQLIDIILRSGRRSTKVQYVATRYELMVSCSRTPICLATVGWQVRRHATIVCRGVLASL